MGRNIGFRSWFYFRMGWSTYFAFIFAAVNTLVVTYYLAIERIPELKYIFPSFSIYATVMIVIGIPLLVLFGYAHFKKSQAYSSEADIGVESNPYYFKLPPGHQKDVFVPLQLLLSQIVLKIATNEKLTAEEIDKLKDIQRQLDILIKGGSVGK
ncbi:MAG TPA: hypothetical protein VI489_03755 [Candidatus Brocadiaceae bacterium]